ncbi:D-(-)-3-hydroxybutyrate oligomer hydrolase [Marinobacterium zhoushanense]|uniref:D-(-)-3-hydroxybutyrate oligomer hydrolase n=1 Tax=Marinobacterium zhoushanense TaxID=1679163 RepID=A0ABQ1KT60_9GAMM|nr:3-hydroxybutyrate oligomer hydrolase family protein [Marinobacterium zhoushanense]GGC10255.1 D-(-)-3-hydroxybutyrate oligomer hydrolase [Marinobacterium zhoushanense]
MLCSKRRALRHFPLLLVCLGLSPATALAQGQGFNAKPAFIGTVSSTQYDGVSDDLLTAGLGLSGLQAAAPALSSPPSTAELRRLAIYNNYRALVDVASNGGFGSLFGPRTSVDADGNVNSGGSGMIAGTEYLAYADDGSGRQNVTLMVQVPAHFSPDHPCIVTGTSSGSRGVYGAIGTAGEWGLQKGCAVAYADKGTGTGLHDLDTNSVSLIDGQRADADLAGNESSFSADLDAAARTDLLTAWPYRVAIKHAHSKQNPEADWGLNTLQAVQFAFYVLNEQFGPEHKLQGHKVVLRPSNTLVIASSASNGAGAALAAAEQDQGHWIDGVAVSEPQIQLLPDDRVSVERGQRLLSGSGKTLFDYTSFANLYQPCAALSTRAVDAPGRLFVPAASAANRCAALRANGLLNADVLADQAEEALDRLFDYGWEPESVLLHASHYAFATPAIAVLYANAYGRFGVEERLCAFSYAGVDAAGAPAPIAGTALEQSFGSGNGIPPTAGAQIINDAAVGGPRRDAVSISPSTGLTDFNVDGARCLRDLLQPGSAEAQRVQQGIDEVLRRANLHGKPAIIVHGRSDALVPVGFSSRPYFGLNQLVEQGESQLRYIEVTNAQHFDAFIDHVALPGYDSHFVPLHPYLGEALDWIYDHLSTGRPLPLSQVVRTTPRGGVPGAAPALTSANLPPIAAQPAAEDLISFDNGTVYVPD